MFVEKRNTPLFSPKSSVGATCFEVKLSSSGGQTCRSYGASERISPRFPVLIVFLMSWIAHLTKQVDKGRNKSENLSEGDIGKGRDILKAFKGSLVRQKFRDVLKNPGFRLLWCGMTRIEGGFFISSLVLMLLIAALWRSDRFPLPQFSFWVWTLLQHYVR